MEQQAQVASRAPTPGAQSVVLYGYDKATGTLVPFPIDLLTGGVQLSLTAGFPHSSLSGLTSGDDHTQYLKNTGRSGGQTPYGGTSAGNTLKLRGNTADSDEGAVDLRNILVTDNAANPASAGRLARNGAKLKWHDGTAVRRLLLQSDVDPADAQMLVWVAATAAWVALTISGDLTISNTGVVTIANNAITTAKIAANAVDMATKMTGTMAAAQFPALTGDVTTSAGSLATAIGNQKIVPAMLASSTVDNGLCEGRLTGTSATPVTTADVTGAGTLYFTPYKGGRLALYTSSVWKLYTLTEISKVLTGLLTSGKNYDVFVYDSAGSPTLELSAAWTSDTARFGSGVYATALPTQDGVYVKSTDGTTVDASRRYLGSFRATGTGTTEDSKAQRYLWNYYNRVEKASTIADSTSHTYNSSFRAWNNGAGNYRVQLIQGVAEDVVHATVNSSITAGAGSFASVDYGVDSTTVASGSVAVGNNNTASISASITYIFGIGLGYHYIAVLEASGATASTFSSMDLQVAHKC